MNYEEQAQLRYQEMCRIVGDVVFAMVAEKHETKRVAIADVIRTELAKGIDKWDEDQLQCMELAVLSDNPNLEKWYISEENQDQFYVMGKALLQESIQYNKL